MKTYILNEIKGILQGDIIAIEAETPEEAFEKSGLTEKIRIYDRFETIKPGKMYELYERGKPTNVFYICR